MSTTVASANVLYSLGRRDATAALSAVLAHQPDLVGLQEWYPARWPLLRPTGSVSLVAPLARLPRSPGRHRGAYHWSAPLLGGCAVGARADRYRPVRTEARVLSLPGRGDRDDRLMSLEPPRIATVAVYRDLLLERSVCLVDYHLVSGVQRLDVYRPDRPRLAARHRGEVAALARLVTQMLERGHVVHATGDSNFHGLRLPGLVSCWDGRPEQAGTLGPRRQVDDVHGPGPAEAVTLVTTASDHRAVLARRPD